MNAPSRRPRATRALRAAATLAALLAAALAGPARAADTLVVGQVAELSGQRVVAEGVAGAQLWFDNVNRDPKQPHHFVLKQYDDKRDPALTVSLTHKLLDEDNAVALFGYRSTPSLDALAKEFDGLGVALVAPFNGSAAVRRTAHNAFFLRGSYQDEARRLVQQLVGVGVHEVAIVSQSDAFGVEGRDGYVAALKAERIAPVALLEYDRKTLDTRPAVAALLRANPAAALLACTPKACADIINGVRAQNPVMLLGVMSNTVNADFIGAVAAHGRGVLMSQVMPYPWNEGTPIVREFDQLNAAAGNKVPLSYASLEGFAAAKLLTEAVRRAPAPTRAGVLRALREMHGVDLGGIVFDVNGQHYFTEVTTLDATGRILR